MGKNTGWKRIVYLMCAIQVGAGIAMIGVTDAGEAAFWAGLISGVTPFMIALSAPFWSIQADRRGPKLVMSIVLAAVTLTAFLCAVSTSPWQVFIFRLLQGLVGGFVPIGLSVIASVSPEEETSRTLGYFQAAMVSGIMFGPLVGGLVADTLGYRMPFVFFGVLSLICLICLRLFMPEIHRKGASGEKSSTWQELKYFAAIPRVRLMVGIQFLCNFGITGIGPILPLYIKDMLGGGSEIIATIVGIIIFLAGGASALCSLSTGAVTARVSLPRLLTAATVFVGLTFIMQYMCGGLVSSVPLQESAWGSSCLWPIRSSRRRCPMKRDPSSSASCQASFSWATWRALYATERLPWYAAMRPFSGLPRLRSLRQALLYISISKMK